MQEQLNISLAFSYIFRKLVSAGNFANKFIYWKDFMTREFHTTRIGMDPRAIELAKVRELLMNYDVSCFLYFSLLQALFYFYFSLFYFVSSQIYILYSLLNRFEVLSRWNENLIFYSNLLRFVFSLLIFLFLVTYNSFWFSFNSCKSKFQCFFG